MKIYSSISKKQIQRIDFLMTFAVVNSFILGLLVMLFCYSHHKMFLWTAILFSIFLGIYFENKYNSISKEIRQR